MDTNVKRDIPISLKYGITVEGKLAVCDRRRSYEVIGFSSPYPDSSNYIFPTLIYDHAN
jgi:hypothetical protein